MSKRFIVFAIWMAIPFAAIAQRLPDGHPDLKAPTISLR